MISKTWIQRGSCLFRNTKNKIERTVSFQISDKKNDDSITLRERTLSMWKGGRRVFVGFMKHFRYILMGHENFSKFVMDHKICSDVLFS